jgi:WD40 repeat protein
LVALVLGPAQVSAGPLEFSRAAKSPDSAQVLTSVVWSPDGRLLASAGESPSVFVWETAGLKLVHQLDSGAKGLPTLSQLNIAFSADGKWLAAGCRAIRLWDTATWTVSRELIGPDIDVSAPQPIGIQSLLFSPHEQSLVASYHGLPPRGSPVVAFRISDGGVQWTYELHSQFDHPRILPPLIAVPDKHEFVFASGQMSFAGQSAERSTAVVFLDGATGTETRRIERIHSQAPAAVALSRDEKLLATASHYGTTSNGLRDTDPIRIWDAASGKTLHELPIEAGVWTLAFTPDGRYLVASQTSAPGHNQLAVWKVDSWTQVQTVSLSSAQTVRGLAFSPDGTSLAAVAPHEIALFRVSAELR